MIIASVQKSETLLSSYSLPLAPGGLNDKSLAGHNMRRYRESQLETVMSTTGCANTIFPTTRPVSL